MKEQNVVVGFSRFDLPLLASYPRSGTNWIRYFVEVCSNRPSPGQTCLIEGNNYIIDRAHCAYPILHRYKKLILIIRDYRECLLRQNKSEWLSMKDVEEFLGDNHLEHPCIWYIKNIEAFDRFNGEKLLVYYEDLIHSPAKEFPRLGKFLGISDESLSKFIDEIDNHSGNSISAYTAGGHSSETTTSNDTKAHAKKLLTEDQKVEFDNYYKTRFPALAQRYLKRYFTVWDV